MERMYEKIARLAKEAKEETIEKRTLAEDVKVVNRKKKIKKTPLNKEDI